MFGVELFWDKILLVNFVRTVYEQEQCVFKPRVNEEIRLRMQEISKKIDYKSFFFSSEWYVHGVLALLSKGWTSGAGSGRAESEHCSSH